MVGGALGDGIEAAESKASDGVKIEAARDRRLSASR